MKKTVEANKNGIKALKDGGGGCCGEVAKLKKELEIQKKSFAALLNRVVALESNVASACVFGQCACVWCQEVLFVERKKR